MKRLRWAPGVFLLLAGLLAGSYCLCHALGWRAYTCVLSGSLPAGATEEAAVVCGGLYALSYFAAVVAAPILFVAAGLLVLFRTFVRRRPASVGREAR